MVIIGLLLLIVFGPARIGQMARDFRRFAYEARSSIQEFKDELTAVDPPNREMKNGRRRRQGEKPAKKPANKEKPQGVAEEG